MQNYTDKMKILNYVEEIQCEQNMRDYDLSRVSFHGNRGGNFH